MPPEKKGKVKAKGTVEELSPEKVKEAKAVKVKEKVLSEREQFCTLVEGYMADEAAAQDKWREIMAASTPLELDGTHYTKKRLQSYFEKFAQQEAVHEETLKLIYEVVCH